METHLIEARQDGVMALTMNRPKARNALSVEMSSQMLDALRRAQLDSDIRAVVLTGAGGAFCAGGDVKAMAAGRDAKLDVTAKANALRDRAEVSRLLYEMPKPTIAVIPGAAAGAGLALAMACDFRIASANAKLTLAFAKVGLSGDYGASFFLTQIVGASRARELLMLSPLLSADEALALGLLHRVFPQESFAGAAANFVATLAQGPSVALGYIKQNINLAVRADLHSSIHGEALHQALSMSTQDHQDAAKAFVEKRAARFKGR